MATLVKTSAEKDNAPGNEPWDALILLTALELDEIAKGGAARLETVLPPGIPCRISVKKTP